MVSLTGGGPQSGQLQRDRKSNGGWPGTGGEGKTGSWCSTGTEFQFGVMNKFRRWVVVMGGDVLKAADLHTSRGTFCVTCILPLFICQFRVSVAPPTFQMLGRLRWTDDEHRLWGPASNRKPKH